MTTTSMAIDARALEAVARLLGEQVRDAEPMSWGWATPTACLCLASGRRVVVQRRSRAAADRIVLASRVFTERGLPVAPIEACVSARTDVLLVFDLVPGDTAAAHLEGPGGRGVARLMGAALATVRSIDPGLLPVDEAWQSPDALRGAASSWRLAVPSDVLREEAESSIQRTADIGWTAAVSHGDYVPVNALVRRGGLAALLDLDDVAVRHPLVDPAWWGLIVRHHHRASFRPLFDALVSASGAGGRASTEREFADVAVARALQLTAATGPNNREHRQALVATAVAWARG